MRRRTRILATLCDCSKAFDKCRFDLLFNKLLERGVPAIVVRVLIFCYEQQVAWVKWGNVKSQQFGIKNGTCQGAVLSPPCFAVYLDDLLKEVRKLGVGCHMAGKWMGATAYADDLLLMSPTRSGMQAMLAVCQKYAEAHNITFSVDANPVKSKTKMLYVCGDMEYENYPAQLVFCGRPLPFVKTALHLGHTLSQDGTMAQDAKIRRAQYIDRTTDVRTMFHFASPEQMLAAADKYCGDHYGVMLYNLYDEGSEKYFRCWGTLTKLSWNVPRGTHKYFVPNLLSAGHMSTRTKLLGRYVNFFRSLLKSECEEVALVANIAGRDRSSTTGINLAHIQAETGLNPWNAKSYAIMQELRDREETIPP